MSVFVWFLDFAFFVIVVWAFWGGFRFFWEALGFLFGSGCLGVVLCFVLFLLESPAAAAIPIRVNRTKQTQTIKNGVWNQQTHLCLWLC